MFSLASMLSAMAAAVSLGSLLLLLPATWKLLGVQNFCINNSSVKVMHVSVA
jgi:hypothetical protein